MKPFSSARGMKRSGRCRRRGVLPAQEGFGADQAAAAQAELGLVVEAEFVAFEGAAQFVFQGHAFGGLEGEVAGVELDAVPAFGFGLVHGGVGVLDEGGGVAAVLGEAADADAGADEEFVVLGFEWGVEAGEQALGQLLGLFGVAQVRQEDDEFVAAEAGDGVVAAELVAEAGGDALEEDVADGVAEAVVDVFEAVEVEEQDGAFVAFAFAGGEGLAQAAFEEDAVGQAGEGVVVGLVVESGLGLLER